MSDQHLFFRWFIMNEMISLDVWVVVVKMYLDSIVNMLKPLQWRLPIIFMKILVLRYFQLLILNILIKESI